ncbi:hypothetical protein DPMN_052614, partial [Dreissena polymorpha]
IMKLHRYIDHDWQMTPIDFQVTTSKVTVTANGFTQWLPLQLTAHMGGMHVLQTALVSYGLLLKGTFNFFYALNRHIQK